MEQFVNQERFDRIKSSTATFLERYIRPGFLFYLLALISMSQFMFFSELFFPLSVSTFMLTMIVAVIVPGIIVTAGLIVRSRYADAPIVNLVPYEEDIRHESFFARFDWLILAIIMFSIWSGGYMLVGYFTSKLKMSTLMFGIDHLIPFRPEWVWFYLTVYMFFLLPFFVMNDKRLVKMVIYSYITVLLMCYTVYFAFPVWFPHNTDLQGNSYSIWALKMVHEGDPPWNCFPSSHCAMALMAALVLLEINLSFGIYGLIVAFSIGVSTLFTKQHYFVDVIAGFGLTLIVYYAYFKGRIIEIMGEKSREFRLRVESVVEGRVEEIVRRVVREELEQKIREINSLKK